MEINRKTYSEIISLIKGVGVDSDKALELADNICTLLESTTVTQTIPQIPLNNTPTIKTPTVQLPVTEPWQKRIFKPFEKVPGGQVDANWKYTPILWWKWMGWIANPDGSLNMELTKESII